MVPKFPGSLTSSKAKIKPLSFISLTFGILKTAKHEFGVANALIFFNSASEMAWSLSFETDKKPRFWLTIFYFRAHV